MRSTQANADPRELEKFAHLAHRWWDPQGEFKALHHINPLRLGWVDELAGIAGKAVLDVGCGGGILADALARRGARQVLGIDLVAASLRAAQLHALDSGTPNISYREISAEQLAQEAGAAFDIVTCMELLEHVPDPAAIVTACARLARPGGWGFFSTIHRSAKAFALAIVAAEYLLKLVPRGTHEYARFIQPKELAQWARQAGLYVHACQGLQYNPVTGHHRLGGDTSVNYLMAARRPAPSGG